MTEENYENIDLKKTAQELLKIKGRTRGSETLSLAKYVESKYGKEGVKKIEDKMDELGHPFRFKEIKPARWYSESHNNLAMIVAKDIFKWKDLFELGYNSPAFSFGVKIFVRLISPERMFIEAGKTFKKFVDVGSVEPYEFNKEKKYLVLHFKGYKFHPLMCSYYAGFFLRLAEYVIKSDKITIEESKCMYKGGDYHEYIIKWQ